MKRLIAIVVVSGFLSFILSGEVLALSDNEINSQHIAEADGISGQNADTGSGVKTNHIQDDAVTASKIANDDASPKITNVRAVAKKGTKTNIGVYNGISGTVRIDHSVIIGATRTIYNDAGVTTRVGNTKPDGKATYNKGTLTCADVYDENYTFSAGSDCP